MAEAAAQFQMGLDQLALLPDDSQRQRQELEFWSSLGAVLLAVKGYAAPQTGQAYARAPGETEGVTVGDEEREEWNRPLLSADTCDRGLRNAALSARCGSRQMSGKGRTRPVACPSASGRYGAHLAHFRELV